MIKSSILLFGVALAAPVAAHAACDATDIGGKWAVYATKNNNSEYWSYCRLDLNTSGELAGTKSYCKTVGQPEAPIVSAEIDVQPNCRVNGYFEVSGDRQVFKHAWMTDNGQLFTGVGRNPSTTFAFNSVRK